MARFVKVERVIRIEYWNPIHAYPGMSESEIEAWERDENNDIGLMLEDMEDEEITVTFTDREPN